MTPLACALVLAALAELPPSDAEIERFLLEGEVVRTQDAPSGVTGSLRATLRLGEMTHDAAIQTIDEEKMQRSFSSGMEIDFRDSYRNNVAAYRLDRMLGIGRVPVSVVRRHDGKPAAFTWWLDGMITEMERLDSKRHPPDTEAWNRQIYAVRIFDQLIYNFDRNLGNMLVDASWNVWMIDHTRAFKIFDELKDEKQLGERCPARLLDALRGLQKPALTARMEGLLSPGQIDGLLGRRDRIVKHFDRLVKERGKSRVLYGR